MSSNDRDYNKLRGAIDGVLTVAGDERWDEARRSWNLFVDQRPAAVLEAASVEDVQAAVAFAAENGLRVAPQGTGHGSEPLGPLGDALLLKTSKMREISFDPDRGVARAQAGAMAGELADAAGAHGRAPVLGFATTVGATGLALSGGIGWLSRTRGLACNNVAAFELVLASGESVRADAHEHQDLFWALRGGGGRSAIVTSLEFVTHDVPAAYGGMILWPAESAPARAAPLRGPDPRGARDAQPGVPLPVCAGRRGPASTAARAQVRGDHRGEPGPRGRGRAVARTRCAAPAR